MKYMKTKFNEFLFEDVTPDISIEEYSDERSPKSEKLYEVNYQIEVDGGLVEIEGKIKKIGTGRSDEYEFDPNYFSDSFSEKYWDENWENIQQQIINYFINEYK